MKLRFYARYKQFYKNVHGTIGDPIRYDIQSGIIVAQNKTVVQHNGLISHPTGFPISPNWYEFTQDIKDGENVSFRVGGSDKTGESKRTIYTDSDIIVSGKMANFIAFHLINNANSRYNAIEVKIEDVSCSDIITYTNFIITSDSINFSVCDNQDICDVGFNIRQDNEVKSCLENTLIDVSPNKLGNSYFDNSVGQIHPRFHVGYDKDNTALYIVVGFITSVIPLTLFFANLIFDWIFGVGYRKISPFVRTYLKNICEHCGLTLATTPFEVGSNLVGSQELSEPKRGLGSIYGSPSSPYYNSCIMYDSTDNDVLAGSLTTWQDGITPLILASPFLDETVKPHNAKWEVYGKYLFLHRKDSVVNQTPVLDLSNNAINKSWLYDCIEISTEGEKKSPKIIEVTFGEDSERAGAEMKSSYQRVANFGFTNYSSTFGGSKNENLEVFGMIQTTYDEKQSKFFNGYIEQTIYGILPFIGATAWYTTDGDIRPSIGANPYCIIVLKEKAWTTWKMVDYDTTTPILDAEPKDTPPNPYSPYNASLVPYGKPSPRPTYQTRNSIWHFDSEYTDNLFYYFWYIEDTIRFPKRSEKAVIRLNLCCEVLQRLGVTGANRASIGFFVIIPINGKDIRFTVEEIEINYSTGIVTVNCDVYRFNDSNI